MFRVQEKLLNYTHSLDHVNTLVTSTQQSSSLCVLLQALFTDMIPPSRQDYISINFSGQGSGSYNNSKQWRRQSCWRVNNGQLWIFFIVLLFHIAPVSNLFLLLNLVTQLLVLAKESRQCRCVIRAMLECPLCVATYKRFLECDSLQFHRRTVDQIHLMIRPQILCHL